MAPPAIPPPPRTPNARARALLFGFVAREKQAIAAFAFLGGIGLLTLTLGATFAVSSGNWPWLLVYAAIASPFVAMPVWGARKMRKARRHRQDAFVHGVPLRARITMRSAEPPALWWEFRIDGASYAGTLTVNRAGDLPGSFEDTHVWILHHPKKPQRNTLWLQ